MSFFALEGISDLLDTIDTVKDALKINHPSVSGVIPMKYDRRLNITDSVMQELHDYFADRVFETVIPVNVALNEAQAQGKTIFHRKPRSKGAIAYRELTQEVLNAKG
jgi:chromosome partitioning protein